jgi:hypothetical protein
MPILEDYLTKAEQAKALNVSEKTIDRYTKQPDGMPYTMAGRVKLFRHDWTRDWLASRKRQDNPTAPRRGRPRRQPERAGAAP